jgi:hypothetical protein
VPLSLSYNSYTTPSFTVAAGPHTLTFQGVNPRGGDNTAFVDRVQVNTLDWFGPNLQDPGIQSVARSRFTADGSLSRADLIQVLREAEVEDGPGGTMTPAQIHDFQTLVGNASLLGMSDSVRVLANKVVNGDPANAHYQGAPLGNLSPSSTGSQLEKLVAKWFLGLDHPQAVGTVSLSYAQASGSLFGSGGPAFSDVYQGGVGDCWLMAPLAETAFREPWLIRSMFTDNGDGTFAVRFYNNGVADYVTVDRNLPVDSAGTFYYAQTGPNYVFSAGNVLWPALAEKAYAQLCESGWTGCTAVNSYTPLDTSGGFPGPVLRQLTGRPTHQAGWWFGSLSGDNWLTGLYSAGTFLNSYQSGNLITLDSNLSEAAGNGVPAQHVFAVVGYDAAAQTFTLFNPWGVGTHQDDKGNVVPGILHLTWSQIQAEFFDWHEVGP